uniref:Uncharacterized protein n=1 Tax=Meloidogyne floridensis TaxID=298350 RepID=A0A915NE22_9BILA
MFNKFNEFELTITGQGGFYMDESEGYNPDDAEENQPACVPKGKGIFKPSNWKIIGRNPAPEHGHLLVFYMLPQNASRNHSKGDITDKSPDGPNCEELYIEFDKQNYTLLSVGDPPTTTTTTTTTTTRPTTTTTTASTTTKSTPPAVKTTERTTTTTEKPIYRSNDFWFAVARGGFPAGIMLSCFCLIMDINPEVLEHAKKAQKLGPRQMPLPPYCSVGISTISDRPKVDRKEDTATAN